MKRRIKKALRNILASFLFLLVSGSGLITSGSFTCVQCDQMAKIFFQFWLFTIGNEV